MMCFSGSGYNTKYMEELGREGIRSITLIQCGIHMGLPGLLSSPALQPLRLLYKGSCSQPGMPFWNEVGKLLCLGLLKLSTLHMFSKFRSLAPKHLYSKYYGLVSFYPGLCISKTLGTEVQQRDKVTWQNYTIKFTEKSNSFSSVIVVSL